MHLIICCKSNNNFVFSQIASEKKYFLLKMLKKFWRCEKNMYFCGNKFTSNKEKHKNNYIYTKQ